MAAFSMGENATVVFTVIAAYILVHWVLRPQAQLAFSPLGLVSFAVIIAMGLVAIVRMVWFA